MPADKPVLTEAEEQSALNQAGKGYSIAFNFIVTILVGVGIGIALDLWLGWIPCMTLLFLILGFASAFRSLWRDVKAVEGME